MRGARLRVVAAAAVCLLGSCTEPEVPGVILQKIAGDNQVFLQGRALPDTIVVRLTGSGLTGLFVSFTVTEGGGSVSDEVVTPDAGGLVRTVWTLGPGTGSNELVAFSPGQLLTFTATAVLAGTVADSIEAGSLPPAQWPVNDTVRAAVKVKDVGGVPVAGDTVIFSVTAGGGEIGGASQDTELTTATGVAQSHPWRLGTRVGTNTLSASSPVLTMKGRAPVLFTVASTPLAARRLEIRTIPTRDSSTVAFSPRPVVEVRDTFDNPVAGNGQVVTARLASGPSGARLMGRITATIVGGAATFDSLVVFGPPGTVALRFATPGLDSTLSDPIGLLVGPPSIYTSTVAVSPTTVMAGDTALVTMTIRDDYGTPVSGFFGHHINSSSSGFHGVMSPSNSQGESTTWLVPTRIEDALFGLDVHSPDGIVGVFGVFPANRVVVRETALEVRSSGGSLSFLVQPLPLMIGDVITPAPQVEALDSTGARMTGFNGTVTICCAGVGGDTAVTAVNGIAVFSNLAGPGPGQGGVHSQRLHADSPGLYSARSDQFSLFPAGDVVVTVQAGGSGSGKVSSFDPIFLACSMVGQQRYGTCIGAFRGSNTATLTATPAPGSVFMGWSGDCNGVGDCVLTNNGAPMTVTAKFE